MAISLWGPRVKRAQQEGDRLEGAAETKVGAFRVNQIRVLHAARIAEDAALGLIQRQDDLARIVARRG